MDLCVETMTLAEFTELIDQAYNGLVALVARFVLRTSMPDKYRVLCDIFCGHVIDYAPDPNGYDAHGHDDDDGDDTSTTAMSLPTDTSPALSSMDTETPILNTAAMPPDINGGQLPLSSDSTLSLQGETHARYILRYFCADAFSTGAPFTMTFRKAPVTAKPSFKRFNNTTTTLVKEPQQAAEPQAWLKMSQGCDKLGNIFQIKYDFDTDVFAHYKCTVACWNSR